MVLGVGVNPARWVPEAEGAGYDLPVELAMAVEGFEDKVSVLTGFDTPPQWSQQLPALLAAHRYADWRRASRCGACPAGDL